jgi:hypothetical protein
MDSKAISDSDFRQCRLASLVQEIIFISDETIGAQISLFSVRTPKSIIGAVSEWPTSCSDLVIAPRKNEELLTLKRIAYDS